MNPGYDTALSFKIWKQKVEISGTLLEILQIKICSVNGSRPEVAQMNVYSVDIRSVAQVFQFCRSTLSILHGFLSIWYSHGISAIVIVRGDPVKKNHLDPSSTVLDEKKKVLVID